MQYSEAISSPTLDFVTPSRILVVRSASGTGFNYTQQDLDVHTAERASIPATYAIASIFPVLAIVTVILRFIAASRSKAGRTADDWVILAALVPTIASCIWMICTYIIDKSRIMKSFFAEAEKGNFTELDDPLGNANALQWGPGVVSTFYLTALTLIKISVFLLYGRLFPTQSMKRIVQVGVVFVIACWITFVVPSLLGLANAHGVSNGIVFIFILTYACINLATDITLLALPIPFVWKLNLSPARKMQIVGMFSLGAFCVISSSVRLAYLADYWQKLQFLFAHEKNWYATFTLSVFAKSWWMSWIWALIEPCTSIIAASLPTLRPLVDGLGNERSWIKRVFGVLYHRSLSTRSIGRVNSESSTELSKVHIIVKRDLGISEQRVQPKSPLVSPRTRMHERPDDGTCSQDAAWGRIRPALYPADTDADRKVYGREMV